MSLRFALKTFTRTGKIR